MTISFTDGTVTSTSAEQTIFDISGDAHYASYLFTQNMAAGDSVRIRVYVLDQNSSTLRIYEDVSLVDVQSSPGYFVPFIPCREYKVTIQRITGTDRAYTWLRAEDGTSAPSSGSSITETLTNKTIAIENNIIALRMDTYNVFKLTSTYYAVRNDGVVSSSPNFSTIIQNIVDSIPTRDSNTFTKIKLAPGTFDVNTEIDIFDKYNLHFEGAGNGQTRIQAGPSLGASAKIFDIEGSTSSTGKNLTANSVAKAKTVTMSTSDSATFAVNDFALLRSSALFWSGGSAFKGEIKQITNVNTGTGVITFGDTLFDTYLTADTANLIKLLPSKNIRFSNLTIGKNASYSGTGVWLRLRFIDGFKFDNVTFEDPTGSFDSCLSAISCINSKISGCEMLFSNTNTINDQYGIAIQNCSQNIVISHCNATGPWRHAYEAGNNKSGTDNEGVCRAIEFIGCTSRDANNSGFDTHHAGEGIQFANCHVLGKRAGQGFNTRCKRTKITDCYMEYPETAGIGLSENANECDITNCHIVKAVNRGIWVQDGVDFIKIEGNIIEDPTGLGIQIDTGSDNLTITNNIIYNGDTDAINVTNSDKNVIVGNQIRDNAGWGINFQAATCTDQLIIGNNLQNNTSGAINNGGQSGNIEFGNAGIRDFEYFEAIDEFTCGSISNTNTSNSIGDLNWGLSTTGTSAPVVTAGVTSHPGIISLVTGATSGNNERMHLTDASNTAFCDPADIERFAWIVRVPTITTMSVRIGVGQDLSSTTFGTAGAWFSFDSAVDTHWQTITRQASTSTTNTTTDTVTAGNWFLLEAIRLGSGNWEFYVNTVLRFTHSTNQPTTACNVGAMVQTATTAARNLDIDFFKIRTKKMAQRWT